jgi:tetratricopeptide (TPR) repeat protein
MIFRISTATARILLLPMAVVLAVVLAYSSICDALAAHYAGLNTLEGFERATRLEPSDAANWYLLGRYWQYNLEDPNSEKAIAAYKRALALDAHSADTWSDLAMACESEGEPDAARNAFLQAKRAYPLSPEVAWRFGNFLLRRGETDAAFAEIRRSVEVDPNRAAAALALGTRVEPDFDRVLQRVVPPSQQAYLTVIAGLNQERQTAQALRVWNSLMQLHPHLNLRDSTSLIEGLLEKHQASQAQQVWNQAVAAAGVVRPPDPPESLVWDGGFESTVINVGLSWNYLAFSGGVQIARDARVKHSGNFSLRLTFNGLRNVDFRDVCQDIAVQPDTPYFFSAWAQTRAISTDEGVRFGLQSFGNSGNSTVWSDDVRGTQPWTQIRLPWRSGPDVRHLRLCISRRLSAKFDSKISGYAWIDDVALLPVTTESAPR